MGQGRRLGCQSHEDALEVLTQCVDLEAAPADDGAADGREGFVDVVADLPADAQPPEPVQQGDGLFHDVPVFAQPRAVGDAAAGDDRADAFGLD